MEDSVSTMTSDNDEKLPISTLVFMDLEATGLPSFVGKKNVHITEMSFIAIDRQSFKIDSSLRVRNKLSLCVRPRSTVSPTAMTITGLYNDVLEKQEKFDDSIPKLLEYFFRRLQRPICLLAHNGNKYDFPLLQAELRNINYALDPQILCADTLQAIRFIVSNPVIQPIDPSPPENHEKLRKEEPKTNGEIPSESNIKDNDPEVEILLTQDMDIFKDIQDPQDLNVTFESKNPNQLQTAILPTHLKANEKTPTKLIINSESFSVSTNPNKKAKLDPLYMKNSHQNGVSTNLRNVHAKRQLFADGADQGLKSNVKPSKPLQFSLEKLYHHFFGEKPPTSHYAEADCIALSKVCQQVSPDFLRWIDANSSSFCETKAMW